MIISQPELGLPVVSLALKQRWGRREKREFITPLPLGLLFAFSPTDLPDDPACFAFFFFFFFYKEHYGHIGVKC